MPGRDQTGPRGAGPMTGRARGPCNTNATPGIGGRGAGRGARGGMGRGRQQGYGPQSAWADIEKRLDALERK
jgi:hypothetical protein